MVTQINPNGSLASEIASLPLASPKPPSAKEKSRADNLSESAKSVEASLKEVNAHLKQAGSKLEIQTDKATGRNVFKIVDLGTDTVVLQIPSEEILAIARKLREATNAQDAAGVLMDKEG